MPIGRMKQKLVSGELLIGSWLTFPDCGVAEIMAKAGFDWLTVDMEHSAIDLGQAQELIRVISLCEIAALVRLPANDAALAKRVMDAGASGVIVPMVNSADEARAAVAAVKYAPAGRRSVGLARAQGYGTQFEDYVGTANERSLVIVQIEHIEAVRNLEAILGVSGVDALMVGPYDLTGSMGIPGQFDRPEVAEALARILAVSRALNVPAGMHVVQPSHEEVLERAAQGFRLIAYSVDFLLLGQACRSGVADIRRGLEDGEVTG